MRVSVAFWSAWAVSMMWARWHIETAARNALRSSLWDAGILAFGAVTVDALITSRAYVVPIVLGGATGNYMAIRRAS